MKRMLLSFALIAALPLAASAAELDYSYIEGGYQNFDVDGGADADGWNLGGSAALGQNFHLFGSYGQADLKGVDLDVDIWRVGLGWNTSISDSSDLVVRANYLQLDSDLADADGYEAEVGLRSALGDQFETYVALGYVDGDDGREDVYGKLAAQYRFNPTWGLTASATVSDGANEYFIGPRITF